MKARKIIHTQDASDIEALKKDGYLLILPVKAGDYTIGLFPSVA